MTANALIQARVEKDVKDRAAEILESMGLTVSDAVRILLTRVANEGALPAGLVTDPEMHDRWFREKVLEALEDTRATIPHADVENRFAQMRDDALRGHTGD